MATETDTRKTVLITGCAAGGIGHSLALSFHKRGFRVFATARSLEQLTTLAEQGIETLVLVVDDDDSILKMVKTIENLTGGRGLDFLVNNAGTCLDERTDWKISLCQDGKRESSYHCDPLPLYYYCN